ncbi:hypothetical protein HYH02_001970 [Chlamydomonas schloesseri]|uniref:Pherophorin domain-containing protein n=1 Tax=Chlamydomonas schloesseri TaxID=2026947 RepID=A0A836BCG0_9CHLO|nr:hypothetical protein HYH02_001970 [Chlamydomonas schloesseri]|eukprot:KAG2453759.1 hypothetical protein HYH02_001970 [Chlamydomonas schloesseri]
MVDDEGDEELQENLEHLDMLLVGACGDTYESVPEGERHMQLAEIVQEARRAAKAASLASTAASNATAAAVSAAASQLMGLALGSYTSGSREQDGGSTGSSAGTDRVYGGRENVAPDGTAAGCSGTSTSNGASAAVVRELAALCSGAVPDGFLQYALERKYHGHAEALAAWLLDASPADLEKAAEEWEELRDREAAEAEQARLLKEHNKKQILSKFDLRPVTAPKDPRKVAKGVSAPDAFIGKESEGQKKVRYLDGRVVSNKGEKFIIERIGEEWDGGSRGKVYTKGKRAPDSSAHELTGLAGGKPLCVTIRSFPADAGQPAPAAAPYRFTAAECQRVQLLLVAELTSAAESWGIRVTRAFRPAACTGVAISVCGAVSDASSMKALGSRMQDTSPRYFRALFDIKPTITACPPEYRDAKLALEILAARGSADECLVVIRGDSCDALIARDDSEEASASLAQLGTGEEDDERATSSAVYEEAAHNGGRRLRALFWPFSLGSHNQQCERKAYGTPFVLNPLVEQLPGPTSRPGSTRFCFGLHLIAAPPGQNGCDHADALGTVEVVANKALSGSLLGAKLRSTPAQSDASPSASPYVAVEKDLTTEWVAVKAGTEGTQLKPGQQGHLLRVSGLRLRTPSHGAVAAGQHEVCLDLAAGATLADLCGGGSCVVALRDPRGKCCPSYAAAVAGPGQHLAATGAAGGVQQTQQVQKQQAAGGRKMARSVLEVQ